MEVEGQRRRPPKPVAVDVTAAEVAMCADFAATCSRRRGYALSGGWKGGLVPAMRLFGGVNVDQDTAGIVIGKVGEVAMCKLAGVSVDLALRENGDGGKDLPLPCGDVQVKTSRRSFPTRFVRDPVEQVDWFVFASWNGLRPSVFIDGYMSRAVVETQRLAWAPRGSWMNRDVYMMDLLPIRKLLAIRPIGDLL